MNVDEVKDIVARGEDEQVELKRSTGQRTRGAKTVCAMLNGLGGFVIFGVSDKGDLVGQQVSARTIEDISAEIRKIEPPAFPDISTISLKQGVSLTVLRVPRRQRPLYLRWSRVSAPGTNDNRHAPGGI